MNKWMRTLLVALLALLTTAGIVLLFLYGGEKKVYLSGAILLVGSAGILSISTYGYKTKSQKPSVRLLVRASLLAAMSTVLSLWPSIPIFQAFGFPAKLELSDVPILLGAFAYGPLWGAAIAVVKSVINIMIRPETGIIGLAMNILSSVVPMLLAAVLYAGRKTRKRAIYSLVAYVGAMVLVMIPTNLFFSSLYFVGGNSTYMDGIRVVAKMLPWVALFNLIKAGACALITGILYKPLSTTVLAKELRPEKANAPMTVAKYKSRRSTAIWLACIGAALLVGQVVVWAAVLHPSILGIEESIGEYITKTAAEYLSPAQPWYQTLFYGLVFNVIGIMGLFMGGNAIYLFVRLRKIKEKGLAADEPTEPTIQA